MENIRKVALIMPLIFGLYGLFSFISLGVFIPPFPLKPFLLLVLLFVFTYSRIKTTFNRIDTVFSVWLLVYVFANQYLIETFVLQETAVFFVNNILPVTKLLSAVLFASFIWLFSIRVFGDAMMVFLLRLLGLTLLLLVFYVGTTIVLDLGISIVILFTYFLYRKSTLNSIEEEQADFFSILTAIALINLIEHLSLMFGS